MVLQKKNSVMNINSHLNNQQKQEIKQSKKLQSAFNILLLLILTATIYSCANNKKDIVASVTDPNELYSIYSRDVSTLVSDSGITRYKVQAEEWYIYEKAKEPRWWLPQGVIVETFDDSANITSYIEGDTALYYKTKRLWRLYGNVKMANTKGEKFFTEEVFWDQTQQKIYSDSAIQIEQGDKIIDGIGFVSNESMTSYSIKRTTGIFSIENQATSNDTTSNKSIKDEGNNQKKSQQE